MDIATGLVSLFLAFVFMCMGGMQYALDRGEVARTMGGWAVGRTWYELKTVGLLAMAGGAALIAPMVATIRKPLTEPVAGGTAVVALFEAAASITSSLLPVLNHRSSAACIGRLAGLNRS